MVQHELLLALLGCPGGLISEASYEVDEVDFCSDAERAALNNIAGLGASYEVVLAFVDGDAQGGLYLNALQNGLEEQLVEYHSLVVKLEAELLSQPRPLSHLHFKLREAHYHLTLPALARVVRAITRPGRPVKNARILELLHEGCSTGPFPVKRSLERLAQHCHAVLYNFCSGWMLHGRLLDPHGEYFVARGPDTHRAASATASGTTGGPVAWNASGASSDDASNWSAWASSAWDLAPWNYEDAGSAPTHHRGERRSSTTLSRTQGRLEQEEHEWHNAFVLRIDALPLSYLPASLAQQILFVGKAVRTLHRGTATAPSGKTAADIFSEDDGHQLRLADEEIASFAARFNALKAARHFHLLSFEALVKNLHTIVAERLWRLVMVEAQLVEHLRAVRDLVLMGHGALWHELIVQGRDLMRHPPTTRSEEALRIGPLASARRRCGMDEDHHAAGRLRVVLALESFACRHFDTVVGFILRGSHRHDRDTRTVVLAPPRAANAPNAELSARPLPPLRWHRSGSLVSRGKKKVRRSFASLFKFTWSPAGLTAVASASEDDGAGATLVGAAAALRGGSVHVSLVIANELKTDADESGNSSTGAMGGALGSFDGVTGVPNSLAVVLELDHAGAHLCLRLSDHRAAENATTKGQASGRLPTMLDIVQLRRRPIPNAPHFLLVEYDASDAAVPTLRVYLDDPHKKSPPTMATSVAIHKVLALDVGAGDAAEVKIHAGVSAGEKDSLGGLGAGIGGASTAAGNGEAADADRHLLPEVSVMVHDWSFAVRSDVHAPPPEANAAMSLVNADVRSGSGGGGGGVRVGDGASFSSISSAASSASSLVSRALPHKGAVDRFLDAQASWDELTVEYEIDWPLHLIITAEATAVYNKIFSLLWATKRTQIDLELCWPILMENRYRRLPMNDNIWLRPLQTLHASMLFFVKNLQIYLQVDVVEAQHAAMVNAMESQRAFDAVRRAHTQYLAAMLKKSHVGVRPLQDGLRRLLRLCRHFSALVMSYATNAADIPHAEIQAIAERFRSDAAYLFLMLERTDAQELATRLDYNSWFTATARMLTGTG